MDSSVHVARCACRGGAVLLCSGARRALESFDSRPGPWPLGLPSASNRLLCSPWSTPCGKLRKLRRLKGWKAKPTRRGLQDQTPSKGERCNVVSTRARSVPLTFGESLATSALRRLGGTPLGRRFGAKVRAGPDAQALSLLSDSCHMVSPGSNRGCVLRRG